MYRRFHAKAVGLWAATLLLASTSYSWGIVVHTTDFISDTGRTNFNSFESLPATSWPVPPNGVSAVDAEDGIRVEQVPRQDGYIATTWWWTGGVSDPRPPDGNRSWYPAGGDHGYTRITRTDGSEFLNVGFFRSSGAVYDQPGTGILLFELLNDGNTVLSGTVPQLHDIPQYLGFSGEGFDEIRVRDGRVGVVAGLYDGTDNALAIDAIEIAVPEPATVLLLLLSGLVMVRRK